jgi:hypothetical protein
VDILEDTTVISAKDDISGFPASGHIIIDNEIISYDSIDTTNNHFVDCIRATNGTTAIGYSADTDVYFLERVQGNPIDIILSLLTSGSGAGLYDTLESGCALAPSLIDIDACEELRDSLFVDLEFECFFYNVQSALKLIEDELLTPLRLRLVTTSSAKLSLKQCDSLAVLEGEVIDDDTIHSKPKWSVDDNRVVNQLEIQWDYNEATGKYRQRTPYEDAASMASFGARSPLKYNFKFVREDLNGLDIIDNLALMLLNRLSMPTPEITLNTQIDKSEIGVLDRVMLNTSKLPNFDGSINFSNEVEVISKGINQATGDVAFKLVFTSGSQNRFCYIAPSDRVLSSAAFNEVTIPSGRGAMYRAGWAMRLYDNDAREYVVGEPVNYIESIDGDVITFSNDFIQHPTDSHRIKFADYDEVIDDQKRFCFISAGGANFSDAKKTYVITL